MKRTCIYPNEWFEGMFCVDDKGILQIHIMHVSVDNYGNYFNVEDEVVVNAEHNVSLQEKMWWTWGTWQEGLDLLLALSGCACLLKWDHSAKAYDVAGLVLVPPQKND